MPIVDDIAGLRRILAQSKTIAVVGLSGALVSAELLRGEVPAGTRLSRDSGESDLREVLGVTCYPNLAAVPERIDVVDCFRRASEMPALAREAVAAGARVFWMQLGVDSDEATRIALAGGLDVVANRCMKIEHGRIMGGLNWAGVNTGVISARRAS